MNFLFLTASLPSHHIALAKTTNTISDHRREKWIALLCSELSGNALISFVHLGGLWWQQFNDSNIYYVQLCFIHHQSPQSFYHDRILNFVKGLSASILMILWFLSLITFIWWMTFIDLCMLKHAGIFSRKPNLTTKNEFS